jgi:hypothetical protein
MDTLRLIGEFFLAVVEEWKGWLTGSLPMAVIAMGALIKPEIAPLPIWEWAILVFVAGFVCAVFRVYRSARLDAKALNAQLVQIGLDRPLTFVVPNFGAVKISDGFLIKRIEFVFENRSDRMISYNVVTLDASVNGIIVAHGPAASGFGYISGRDKTAYSLEVSQGDGFFVTLPITLDMSFGVEYDNVPAISKRVTERTVQYVISSIEPMIAKNVITKYAEK